MGFIARLPDQRAVRGSRLLPTLVRTIGTDNLSVRRREGTGHGYQVVGGAAS